MKVRYQFIFKIFMLIPFFGYTQQVTTLTEVTANGGITVDQNNDLFVAHFGPLPPNPSIGNTLYKITPQGMVQTFLAGELAVGTGVNIDSQGIIYQANFSSGKIFKISAGGMILDDDFATVSGPVGIAIDESDTLYICSCISNSVLKISPDGDSNVFASGASFDCANGITMDDNGNVYTTNFNDGRITKITPDGNTVTLGNSPLGNGHLVFRSTDQMLYIASYTGHQIFRMDLDGNVELFAGTGMVGTVDTIHPLDAQFNRPNGVALSNDECELYITQNSDVLRAIIFDDASCLVSNICCTTDDHQINVYPNPVTNRIFVEDSAGRKFIQARLFDYTGKTILEIHETNIKIIDLPKLSSGPYFLKLMDEKENYFVKQIFIQY